jgi:Stress responsive A/B Barrel Domain
VDEVAAALRELQGLISEIRSFKFNTRVNAGNWDSAVVADFDSIDDQTIYSDHLEHQRVITDLVAPIRADRAAVQYEAGLRTTGAHRIAVAVGDRDRLRPRPGRPVGAAHFECDYPPEVQKPIVSSSGLPENLPLGEINDAARAATAGETPLYRLDEARIAQIQPDLILTQDLCRVCAVPSGDVDEALGRLAVGLRSCRSIRTRSTT